MTPSQVNSALRIVNRFLKDARREQIIDFNSHWFIEMILAGRGFGKTHMGVGNTLIFAFSNPGSNVSIVAPTTRDLVLTCLNNPQCGLLTIINEVDPSLIIDKDEKYNEYILANGTRIRGFTSESFSRLRGPQHHFVWYDEFAASQYPEETLDMIIFGLRLGINPKLLITTTPKPIAIMRQLIKQSDVRIVRGATYDNKNNLSDKFIAAIEKKYENTRLGRQEIHGEVLEDLEGALWQLGWIEKNRSVYKTVEELNEHEKVLRVVVGVDPAVTAKKNSNLTGIIAVAQVLMGEEIHYFVLEDGSIQGTPGEWATVVKNIYKLCDADSIVVEVNQGGDLCRENLRSNGYHGLIHEVRASRGKHARAEPVAALYEQGRVHHLLDANLAKLEDELINYVPLLTDESPDRLDALVWAINHFSDGDSIGAAWAATDFSKLAKMI